MASVYKRAEKLVGLGMRGSKIFWRLVGSGMPCCQDRVRGSALIREAPSSGELRILMCELRI